MNKKGKIKKKEIIFIILAVVFGIVLYRGWTYYRFIHCIGCGRDNRCVLAHHCNCPEDSKTCICDYYDNDGVEHSGLECPNNNINRLNNEIKNNR